MLCYIKCYVICHPMLYNMCHVMLYSIKYVMLCHDIEIVFHFNVSRYVIQHVSCYITNVMLI